jgi:hypothetical protein
MKSHTIPFNGGNAGIAGFRPFEEEVAGVDPLYLK